MQAVQLADVAAGHGFEQPVDGERLAVSLVLVLASSPSIDETQKVHAGSRGHALHINPQRGA